MDKKNVQNRKPKILFGKNACIYTFSFQFAGVVAALLVPHTINANDNKRMMHRPYHKFRKLYILFSKRLKESSNTDV